jgi:RNA polymerase sigma factor (sigma-70 family)
VLGENFTLILQAARGGAEWAWTSIYRDLAPSVLGYLRGQSAADPEDLIGEVFLQVVRDLGGFDGGEREFRAWVFAVARHRLIDDGRRRARRPVEARPDVPEEAHGTGDVEEEVLRDVAADRVRRIIGQLSPDQRDVLLLRVLGDLTVDQAAKALGKSPGAVKALQRRGLETVAHLLAQEGVTL